MNRRRAIALASVAFLVSAAGAWAFTSGASGSGDAAAQAMPAGNTPDVEVAGRDLTLRWTASRFADGTPAETYLVRRFDEHGTERTVGAGCAGTQAGPSCTEREVPAGTWRYSVTPRYRDWTGAEGGPSAPVTVVEVSLALDVTAVTGLPSAISGRIAGFRTAELVGFRLDGPDGPALEGTVEGVSAPAPVPPGGAAAITVTLSEGTPDGQHRIYAVAAPSGDAASAPILVDTVTPTLESLDMLDRDLDGRVDAVEARFSESLAPYAAGTAPWRLEDVPSDGTLESVQVDGPVALLVIDEGPRNRDTAVAGFTVALDPDPAGIRDAAGNLASFPPTAPADRAAPISVGLRDGNVPGGTDGLMEAGDELVVVFSEDLVDDSLPLLTVATESDPVGAGNDTLAIDGISAGAVDTGSDAYVGPDGASATTTSVSIEFGKGAHVLTVVVLAPCTPPLGEGSCDTILGAGGPGPVVFRPAPSLRDAAGNGAAGSVTAEIRLF